MAQTDGMIMYLAQVCIFGFHLYGSYEPVLLDGRNGFPNYNNDPLYISIVMW
jgi:hypothetical protein